MSDICSLFPPFGDPWASCLLLSQDSKGMIHLGLKSGPCWHVMRQEHNSGLAVSLLWQVLPSVRGEARWQIQFGITTGAVRRFLIPSVQQCWCETRGICFILTTTRIPFREGNTYMENQVFGAKWDSRTWA